jgi:cyanophycinase
MTAIFLHGGGDRPDCRAETFGRFVDIALSGHNSRLALVVAETTETEAQASFQAYSAIFTTLGLDSHQISPIFVSPADPLTPARLEQAQVAAIFVCGGLTPLYHQSVCADSTLAAYLQLANISYGGTSAGAAIAAHQAILGGWQAARAGRPRQILYQGAGEDLAELTIRPGLGLVSFAVDVHASQWGTLTRLVHAVDLGLVSAGYAIDEDTMLELNQGQPPHMHGCGHAYLVQRSETGQTTIDIVTA